MTPAHETRAQAAAWALETLRRAPELQPELASAAPLLEGVLRVHWTLPASVSPTAAAAAIFGMRVVEAPGIPATFGEVAAMLRDPWGEVEAGRAQLRAEVALDAQTWSLLTPEGQRETVVHEVCHLLTDAEAFGSRRHRPPAHGARWKAWMRGYGFDRARANLRADEYLRRPVPRVPRGGLHAWCACGPTVLRAKYRKMVEAGQALRCGICHVRAAPRPYVRAPGVPGAVDVLPADSFAVALLGAPAADLCLGGLDRQEAVAWTMKALNGWPRPASIRNTCSPGSVPA